MICIRSGVTTSPKHRVARRLRSPRPDRAVARAAAPHGVRIPGSVLRAIPGLPANSGEQQPPCPPNPVSGVQPPHHGHSLNRTASGLERTSPCQLQHPSTRWCGRVRSMSLGNHSASHVPAKCSVSRVGQSHPRTGRCPIGSPYAGRRHGHVGRRSASRKCCGHAQLPFPSLRWLSTRERWFSHDNR